MKASGADPLNVAAPRGSSLGRPWRRAAFFAVMLLGSLGLCLVLAEIFARAFFTIPIPVQIGQEVLGQRENRAAFRSDPDRVWRLREEIRFPEDHVALPGLVSNAQGLRNPLPIPDRKAENELRLLFIGDSVTFGWGVAQHETFAQLTQEKLRERFPEVSTLSINAGVPAYSLYQGWRFLENEGFAYEPDVVVIGSFGFTDSMPWGGVSDFEQFDRWRAAQPPEWLRGSGLARLLSFTLLSREYPPSSVPTRPRLDLAEFAEVLASVHEATTERGAQLLVVIAAHMNNINGEVPPGTWGPHQRVLGEFAQKLHLGLLEEPALVDGAALLYELSQGREPSELMLDKVHPTPVIHAALADEIVDVLAPWIEMQVRFGRFAPRD